MFDWEKAFELIKTEWLFGGDKALFYGGKRWRFSNFAAVKFEYKGKTYFTAEHAYQCEKYPSGKGDKSSAIWAEIYLANDPGLAKEIANDPDNIQYMRPDWEHVKPQIMLNIKREQVRQNPKLRQNLLDTGDAIIVEDSPVDAIWGRGPNNSGLNLLGIIYMIIREEEGGISGPWSELREKLGLI